MTEIAIPEKPRPFPLPIEAGEVAKLGGFVYALEKVELSVERMPQDQVRFRMVYEFKLHMPQTVYAGIFRWLECELLIERYQRCRVRPTKWVPESRTLFLEPLIGDETKLAALTVGPRPIFKAVVFQIEKPKHRRTIFISSKN